MRLYETTFIINPQTDDATINAQVGAVSDVITKGGGKIVFENRIGTRRLAYPINKLTQGYYANLVFESPAEALPLLEIHYRHNPEYIRNLTVVFEGDLERLLRRHGVGEDEPELPEPRDEDADDEDDDRRRRRGPVGRRETRPYGQAPRPAAATEAAPPKPEAETDENGPENEDYES